MAAKNSPAPEKCANCGEEIFLMSEKEHIWWHMLEHRTSCTNPQPQSARLIKIVDTEKDLAVIAKGKPVFDEARAAQPDILRGQEGDYKFSPMVIALHKLEAAGVKEIKIGDSEADMRAAQPTVSRDDDETKRKYDEIDAIIEEQNKPFVEKNLNLLKEGFITSNEEVFCPFCGVESGYVKTNGHGHYRCKGKCKRVFYLLISKDTSEGLEAMEDEHGNIVPARRR